MAGQVLRLTELRSLAEQVGRLVLLETLRLGRVEQRQQQIKMWEGQVREAAGIQRIPEAQAATAVLRQLLVTVAAAVVEVLRQRAALWATVETEQAES